jgi:hypothetical protein
MLSFQQLEPIMDCYQSVNLAQWFRAIICFGKILVITPLQLSIGKRHNAAFAIVSVGLATKSATRRFASATSA